MGDVTSGLKAMLFFSQPPLVTPILAPYVSFAYGIYISGRF